MRPNIILIQVSETFYLQLSKYTYTTCPKFNNCGGFIITIIVTIIVTIVVTIIVTILYTKQKFKMSSTCTKASMDMSDLGISCHLERSRGGFECLDRHKIFW
jgi:uncharacterized membrane protein